MRFSLLNSMFRTGAANFIQQVRFEPADIEARQFFRPTLFRMYLNDIDKVEYIVQRKNEQPYPSC